MSFGEYFKMFVIKGNESEQGKGKYETTLNTASFAIRINMVKTGLSKT